MNVPGRGRTEVPVYEPKAPKPEEIAILGPQYLACSIKLGETLKGMDAMWAIGGEAGLVMHGVPLEPDRIEVITTKAGAEEIFKRFSSHSSLPLAVKEKRLDRDAEVEDKTYPVIVRSLYGELVVDGVKVEVYGDKQIKVGDWEWGDPIEFKPDITQVVTTDVNLVPMGLESELSFGMGWLDLSAMIATALARQKHRHQIVEGSMDP